MIDIQNIISKTKWFEITLEKIAANKFHESLKLNLCMININGIMENML